jgi:hypothetical protein
MSKRRKGPREQRTFDAMEYFKAIDTKDFLRLVIIGHLYLQAVLSELISERLPQPNAIDLEDLRFLQVVDLAISLELVAANERKPFELLNRLRNKLAHELGHVVTIGEVAEVLESMAPQQLSLVRAMTGRQVAYGIDLQPAVMVLFIDLHSRLTSIREAKNSHK